MNNQSRFQKGEFTILPNRAFLKGKSPEYRSIYLALCDYADKDGFCYPSRPRLASDSGVASERTVDKYLKIMVKDGLITKATRNQGKTHSSNLYQIMMVPGAISAPPGATNDTTPGAISAPPWGNQQHPNYTNELNLIELDSQKNLEMVELLISLIKENNPEWRDTVERDKWVIPIDRLHRIDGRTYQQIEFMIRWVQRDDFWAKNILSTAKLREKFNDLIPKLKADLTKKKQAKTLVV